MSAMIPVHSDTSWAPAFLSGTDCFTGFKHFGDAVGKTVTIADVLTYISEPPADLVQDYFASHGFLVLGLDYMRGDPWDAHPDEGFDRDTWIAMARVRAQEVTPKWLEAVRQQYGTNSKYCAVGYCFGGPFVMNLAGTDDIVAAAFAHPGFLTEDQFKNLKKPLFLSCAESDFTFPVEFRRRAEDILVEVKAQYQIQVFSGVKHGFAVRGDPESPDGRS
ncbi:Alpha/Beta hydrolase protein [Mycena polygramma]|nr:Alpha/Beta hydrolase protein [Mycena polygramma]